jgi:hypothetical protein
MTTHTLQIEKIKRALMLAKPIVGAAVAASDNEQRTLRQKAYDAIVEAIAACKGLP